MAKQGRPGICYERFVERVVTPFINQQLLDHKQVSGCLAKAEAMAYIAMSDSFAEQVEEHQRNYLWALRDLLTEAEQLHEKLLSKWYTHYKKDI